MRLTSLIGFTLLMATGTSPCGSSSPGATSPTPPAPSQAQSKACSRPTDSEGRALYQTEAGGFVERKRDEGGGRFVVIAPPNAAANQAVLVTQQVYDAVDGLERGRRVTLFGYVSSAVSGANPTYSCVEF
jgi:hypothetical protein